jgi:hypothetical protein
VFCDKAASDIPDSIVKELRDPEAKGLLRITAE